MPPFASTAHAFRTGSDLPELRSELAVNWASNDVILLDVVGELPEGIEQGDLDRAFRAATGTWAEINCAGPGVLLTWAQREQREGGDGISTIGFVEPDDLPGDLPRDTPAVTQLQYERDMDDAWRIVEADIYLNARRDWSGADEGLDVDLSTVLAHELGHAFGLLHPCEPSGADDAPECDESFEGSLMYPLYEAAAARISEDDLLGYCYLYPEPRCEVGERGCDPIDPEDPCAFGECDASVPDSGPSGSEDASTAEPAECSEAPDAAVACEGTLEFASPCTRGEECASGLCVGEDPAHSTCTRRCGGSDGPCPTGFSCDAVGGESVCIGAGAVGGGGCSATLQRERDPSSFAPTWAGAFALALFFSRLRRRHVSQQR